MKKTLGLLIFGIFLTGCYANSLTMVGPATGDASGKLTETATSTTINHIVKKKTGKTPFEHVLSEKQIKTLDTAKTKINPCIKSPELCSLINKRIEKIITMKGRISSTSAISYLVVRRTMLILI